jgi:hypothetical protein
MRNQGQKFNEIADFLGLDWSVVLHNYRKMEEEGPEPDFYAKPPIPGRPRITVARKKNARASEIPAQQIRKFIPRERSFQFFRNFNVKY